MSKYQKKQNSEALFTLIALNVLGLLGGPGSFAFEIVLTMDIMMVIFGLAGIGGDLGVG